LTVDLRATNCESSAIKNFVELKNLSLWKEWKQKQPWLRAYELSCRLGGGGAAEATHYCLGPVSLCHPLEMREREKKSQKGLTAQTVTLELMSWTRKKGKREKKKKKQKKEKKKNRCAKSLLELADHRCANE